MSLSVNYSKQNNDHTIRNVALGTAGLIVGWESETKLRRLFYIPGHLAVKNQKQDITGGDFKKYAEIAIRQNNLENKVKLINLNEKTADAVRKEIGTKQSTTKPSVYTKIIQHILRMKKNSSSFDRTLEGKNAFFLPSKNAIVCNFEKFGSPVFHELQHRINHSSSNLITRTFANIRNPLAFIGPIIVSEISLLTDKKPKGEKQGLDDKIKNNCGLLSTLTVLPLTIDEFTANIKGTKLAEKAGVTGEMLTKVKAAHKRSMIGYGTVAIATGVAAWGGNKIRDFICSYKTKENENESTVPKIGDFYAGMTQNEAIGKQLHSRTLRRDFQDIDTDKNGVLSAKEIINECDAMAKRKNYLGLSIIGLAILDLCTRNVSSIRTILDMTINILIAKWAFNERNKINNDANKYRKQFSA